MRAEIYYQSTTNNAFALILLTSTQYAKQKESISTLELNTLMTQQFKGLLGDLGLIYNALGQLVKVYVGVGESTDAAALASVVNRLPPGCYAAPTLSRRALLNWSLAQYRFDHYKAVEALPRILCVDEPIFSDILQQAQAVFLVRDLINMPTNLLGPQALAQVVEQLATQHGGQFQQWVGDELLRDNFPAIHAVGRASASAPRLLSLTWGDVAHPRVTLIGKGVCFDAGGLDIKPSSGMRFMKKDMGGAAQVIGLAQWLMMRKLPIYLQVLIPAVENVIGSKAYRPGDVLTMRNGLTVEIDNTDAEGRLVLADAFVKACEDNPELLIDFATLTGAARVAVGTEISAMFTNDDDMAAAMTKASQEMHDPVWRMPLFAGYEDLFKSNIADMANSSASSYAGAITAALFLQRFITKAVPWAHFDIMAWNVTSKPGKPEGGEAMGMLAVGQYLINRYAQ